MMTFNIATDPWVPVIGAHGPETLSLRDTILRAHELYSISGANGLENVAILRLLGAVIAAVEPHSGGNTDDWWRAWEASSFDSNAYERYFDEHHDEFFLFGDRPFMQVTTPPGKTRSESAEPNLYKLILSAPTPGRNPGNSTPAPDSVSPARATRELLTLLSWDSQGGKLNDEGKKSEYGLYRTLPSDGGALTLLGRDVKQTVLLNTPFEKRDADDLPTWDKSKWKDGVRPTLQPKRGQKYATPRGIASYLTWPTRNIRLYPDADGNVTGVFVGYGWRFRQSADIPRLEPSCGWRTDKKLGTLAAGFRRDQGAWSGVPKACGFTTEGAAEGSMPAASIRWLHKLVSSGKLEYDETLVSGYQETIVIFDKNATAVYGSAVRHLAINENIILDARASVLASIADRAEWILGTTVKELIDARILGGGDSLRRKVTSAYQSKVAHLIEARLRAPGKLDQTAWRKATLAEAREVLDSVAGPSVRPGKMLAFASGRRQLDTWREAK